MKIFKIPFIAAVNSMETPVGFLVYHTPGSKR